MNGGLWIKALLEAVDNIAINIPSSVITNLLVDKYDMEIADARALLMQVRSQMNKSNLSNLEEAKQELIYLSQTASPLGVIRDRVMAKAQQVDDDIRKEKQRLNQLSAKEDELTNKISDTQSLRDHSTMTQILNKW